MNTIKSNKTHFTSILLTIAIFLFSSAVSAENCRLTGTPVGHEKQMILMANGIYDPNDPEYIPPDYDFFVHEIMRWDAAQIAQFELDAKAFFQTRFGVDVDDAQYSGRVIMVPFMLDPRWEYRVYASSVDNVPCRGWAVRDGGFQLVAIDPEGIDLGGDFPGMHAPQGAVAAFGIFNIQVQNVGQGHGKNEDLVLYYQSRLPVAQNSGFPLRRDGNGSLVAPFDVFHPVYGHGWSFAHIWDVPQEDGRLQTNNRNVITFPAGAPYP